MIMIYCPFPSKGEARKVAKLLLNEKSIVCANIFPVNSIYRWKDKIEDTEEHALIAKTNKTKAESAIKTLKKEHSYDTPAIISWEAGSNRRYAKWMEKELE